MVLLKQGEGAACIQLPNIMEAVKDILLRWYSEKKAEQYASNVQSFFKENAAFPDEDVYKLENGFFYRLDIKKKSWKKSKAPTSYVIDKNNKTFWEKYDKLFPYLKTYKSEIQDLIFKETTDMFNQEMVGTTFVCRDRDGKYSLDSTEQFAIYDAISGYVSQKEQDDYVATLLSKVFKSTEMPIFVIDCGITIAAITEKSITQDIDEEALISFLKEYFAPDDVDELKVRIPNAVKYGVDSIEEVLVDENGDFVVNIGGLQVILSEDDNSMGYAANNKHNLELLSNAFTARMVEQYNGTPLLEFFENGSNRKIDKLEFSGTSHVATVKLKEQNHRVYLGREHVGNYGGNGKITFFEDLGDEISVTIAPLSKKLESDDD